jgi:ankyrin repeat protein
MIQKGADPLVSIDGETPLHRAMLNGTHAVANAELLLKHGVDLHSRDGMGWNALDKAALDNLVDATKYLLSKGAEANHRDNRGMTALEVAKERGYTEIVELLSNK